jgi:hypothetical protein
MATEFCTLFDSNYLLKGLVLHDTLLRHRPDARLTVYCFDERAERILRALALPGLDTVALADLEHADPQLLRVKGERSVGEYCWTATPALPLDFFDRRPDATEVTYLDADLAFWSDPAPLFDEMGHASVLITPHRFPPAYRYLEPLGLYNVQFLTFRRDELALEVLRWWHDRCIEWCYARPEDGRFGDQKYLDEWPARFEGVHVLRHLGAVAPWNLLGSRIEQRSPDGQVLADGDPLVFFHFHGTSLHSDGRHDLHPTSYAVSEEQARTLHAPYIEALEAQLERVRQVEPGFDAGVEPPMSTAVRLRKQVERAAEHVDRRIPRLAAYRHGRRLGTR